MSLKPIVQQINFNLKNNKSSTAVKGLNLYFKPNPKRKYSIREIEKFVNQCQTEMIRKGKQGYAQVTLFANGYTGCTKQIELSKNWLTLDKTVIFSDFFDTIDNVWEEPEKRNINKFSVIIVETK